MIKLQGAVVREQQVTFAIVVVKYHLFQGPQSALNDAAYEFQGYFPGLPIVLMAQDHHGRPYYWGRRDIVDFLSSIHHSQIPWKEYTFG